MVRPSNSIVKSLKKKINKALYQCLVNMKIILNGLYTTPGRKNKFIKHLTLSLLHIKILDIHFV